MSILKILNFLSIWSIVIPFVIGLLFYKKLNKDSLIILLLVFIGLIPQVLSNEISKLVLIRNITYNLYTPLEFACYVALFYNKFVINKVKQSFYFTLLFFALISLHFLFNFNICNAFLNEWIIFSNLIQLTWAGLYMLQVYWVDDLEFDKREPFFWYLIAIICYASCTTVFYSLWYVIRSKPFEHYKFVNGIHHVFNISLYLLFSIGILKNKKKDHYNGDFC